MGNRATLRLSIFFPFCRDRRERRSFAVRFFCNSIITRKKQKIFPTFSQPFGGKNPAFRQAKLEKLPKRKQKQQKQKKKLSCRKILINRKLSQKQVAKTEKSPYNKTNDTKRWFYEEFFKETCGGHAPFYAGQIRYR